MACSYCERDIKILARGLCGACYSRQIRGSLVRLKMSNKGKICSVAGCTQPSRSKGFCPSHYACKAQHPLKTIWKLIRSRSKENHPARKYPAAWDDFDVFLKEVGPRPTPEHQLRHLDPDKPYAKDNIVWLPPLPGRRHSESPEEQSTYQKAWNLRRHYKMTVDEYEAILDSQGGVCALCKEAETRTIKRNGRIRLLSVDHCHRTNRNRGLLCGHCNQGIGHFRDDPALLRAAADYIERHA